MYQKNNDYNKNNRDGGKREFRPKRAPRNTDLPKNLAVTIPFNCYGITLDGREYDGSSLLDIMESLQNNDTFGKISIPVYMKASYTSNNPEARWNTVVGYIKSFNPDICEADCIIYAKSIDAYNKLTNPVIVPRVTIKQGKCVLLIGIDIVDESDIKK